MLTGKLISFYDYSIGFNVAFFMLIFFIIVPTIIQSIFRRRYFRRIEEWVVSNGVKIDSLAWCYFLNNKLFFKKSHVQLVCKSVGEGKQFWFLCGSWFWGGFLQNIYIYQVDENGEFKLYHKLRHGNTKDRRA